MIYSIDLMVVRKRLSFGGVNARYDTFRQIFITWVIMTVEPDLLAIPVQDSFIVLSVICWNPYRGMAVVKERYGRA